MNTPIKDAFVAIALAATSLLAMADPAAPLSRAEVWADLVVYREAGLLDLDRDSSVSPTDAAYQAALRRYEALRHSAHYAELVRSYAAG